ncbi:MULTISPECIES: hypothetical protein [unclassified Flavobacterium]|uniref:hypothetical protein n=1 Tax=Flavobacterium sp. ASV13 TaxID=1506583 RepID=UPI000ADB3285|nr:hypothetical protein [Flavobacterium sp. ASV13]
MEIDKKTKAKIILKWRFSKLNSIPSIAQQFNLSQQKVNKIINDYLSPKNKNL